MIKKLKKVYEDALKIYIKKNCINADFERHLKRLFQYAIELKRMDFISKNCLNPLFREALILNGYNKSLEFMQEVKKAYEEGLIWFEDGRLIFKDGSCNI